MAGITDMALLEMMFILLAVVIEVLRPRVMENCAFILGSSKQGKARRASGASI